MQAADILRSSHLGLIQTNKAIIDKHFHIQNLTTNKYKTQSFKYKENLVKCEMKFKSFFYMFESWEERCMYYTNVMLIDFQSFV